jgi:flagellar biosynthesis protein FlhA
MKIVQTWLLQHRELLLIVALLAILAMLFIPVPAPLLDFLLILNFSLALLILLLTLYSDKPTSFSTFPSLLLIVTLYRLALNIASTRLILNDAEAGRVIATVGKYVVGGNYIVGLVVFLILVMVQYIVVTNGAQRVAEVAARFTLDALPGKQMSIDADLNMGLITEADAKARRRQLEKETNFYGSMDGASKFVKGDAIAGIILILINIIGGLAIGVAQLDMPWGEAVHRYTLLTVGDGIVTQIPALIISIATGLLITRAATDAALSEELGQQLTSSGKSLVLVCMTLVFALFLPGLPTGMLLFTLAIFIAIAYFVLKQKKIESNIKNKEQQLSSELPAIQNNDDLDKLLKIAPLELVASQDLEEFLLHIEPVERRFANFRQQFARSMGMILPDLKLSSSIELKSSSYQIRLHGTLLAAGQLFSNQLMVIDHKGEYLSVHGVKTKEPAFGLSAMWISAEQEKNAKHAGYTVVDPSTVVLTHLTELVKRNAAELLTRQETERLLRKLDTNLQPMVDELVPALLTMSDVQRVLQQLLQEKVSIRPLALIVEALLDNARKNKEVSVLVEAVRQKIRLHLIEDLRDKEQTLQVITLEGALEQQLMLGLQQDSTRSTFAVNPQLLEHLIQQLSLQSEKMISQRLPAVLLCYPPFRAPLKQLLDRVLPHLHVLSVNEVAHQVAVRTVSIISHNNEPEVA